MSNYDTPYRPKDNTGSIFRNDRKEKDTHPDGKGSAVIDGVDYWVSSWNAVDKNGNPYRKLSFTAKDAAPQAAPAPRKPSQDAFKARQVEGRTADKSMPHKDAYAQPEDDSEIPF